MREMMLEDHALLGNRDQCIVCALHSSLSTQEQKQVFVRPPPGVRKIVISTNIAETSVTIDDVVYVIDSGKVKENRYDPVNKMASLEEVWASRASCKQRRGRAGRVRPGIAFHLYSSEKDATLDDYTTPEMLRVPLEETALAIKAC